MQRKNEQSTAMILNVLKSEMPDIDLSGVIANQQLRLKFLDRFLEQLAQLTKMAVIAEIEEQHSLAARRLDYEHAHNNPIPRAAISFDPDDTSFLALMDDAKKSLSRLRENMLAGKKSIEEETNIIAKINELKIASEAEDNINTPRLG